MMTLHLKILLCEPEISKDSAPHNIQVTNKNGNSPDYSRLVTGKLVERVSIISGWGAGGSLGPVIISREGFLFSYFRVPYCFRGGSFLPGR